MGVFAASELDSQHERALPPFWSAAVVNVCVLLLLFGFGYSLSELVVLIREVGQPADRWATSSGGVGL
jgi:hypothetical protein